MPLNPFTGEIEGYDSPSTQAGVGMATMSATGLDVPLAFQMLEYSPGLITAAGYSTFRGTNTLMRGGSGQDISKFDFTTRKFDRSKDFFGSGFISRGKGTIGRRATRLTADAKKIGIIRPALRSNLPRPKNFMQLNDLSGFADSKYSRYTPFGASSFLGNTGLGKKAIEKMGIDLKKGQSAFGPGLFSAISAGRKIDLLEKKALDGNVRALQKLGIVDNNISTLAKINNMVFVKGGSVKSFAPAGGVLESVVYKNGRARVAKGKKINIYTGPDDNMVKKLYKSGQFLPGDARVPVFTRGRSAFNDAMNKTVGLLDGPMPKGAPLMIGGNVGVRRNMMASSMAGAGTRYLAGYAGGSLGFGGMGGLSDRALDGAKAAEKAFASAFKTQAGPGAFGDEGLKLASGRILKTGDEAIDFLRSTGGSSFFREIGAKGVGKIATSGGGKMIAARAAGLAIPGLNILAAASFAYDIGKMGGAIVKSGIELARDAGKSIQGSIAKPMFGMGYKDTEAAATSRARGVMAIQNSRLNMRSLLGSEAAMMAAHYG